MYINSKFYKIALILKPQSSVNGWFFSTKTTVSIVNT